MVIVLLYDTGFFFFFFFGLLWWSCLLMCCCIGIMMGFAETEVTSPRVKVNFAAWYSSRHNAV